jgi:hypothetical protein
VTVPQEESFLDVLKRQIHRNRKKASGCLGPGRGMGKRYRIPVVMEFSFFGY